MTVLPPLDPRPVPLRVDDDKRLRMWDSRIPLEVIIEYYQRGMTPEEIVECYDLLRLSDVYTLIGYYLDNRNAVDEYLQYWKQRGDEMERMIRAAMPPGLKEELLKRRAEYEAKNASAIE
jgi:uncharacterized protein (DUF433 family)